MTITKGAPLPVSRLFISHSSSDNVQAKAFKQWLTTNGWQDQEIFLDLDDIGAGERWKEALRDANLRCEAVILLASPEALSSPECLTEVRKAEDYGKEIIVILLRDLQVDDRRLASYRDRQIVNLAAPPQDHVEAVDYRGQRLEVRFNGDSIARVKEYLARRGLTPEFFAWPPAGSPHAEPFPGLSSFTEADAGIYFGRDSDILRGLDRLRVMRRDGRPRVLIVQGASGAGKSSYLRAGLWPRLERDPDSAPLAVLRPAQGILTGPNGIGRRLATALSRPDAPLSPGEIHARLTSPDVKLASASFSGYVTTVVSHSIARRRLLDVSARPPAFFVAVDQAEELFGSEDAEESRRFLLLLATLIREPPEGVEPFVIFTVRTDGAERLLQALIELGLDVPETLPLLPLPRTSYRDAILKPLDILARRGQKLSFSADLTERLVQDAAGADALPLLAFTLAHLYREFSAGGKLTLEQYEAAGGVPGSIDRALKLALARPNDAPPIPSDRQAQLECLRAAFIPWLARIDPETGLPIRRVARLEEIPSGSRPVVERLIEARLLVSDRRGNANIVEIAHESLLRQWPALTEWLAADAQDLKLVDAVERAAMDWTANGRRREWLAHQGPRLRTAERVAARKDFRNRLGEEGIAYLDACRNYERRRKVRLGAAAAAVVAVLAGGALAWRNENALREGVFWLTQVRGYVLSGEEERGRAPSSAFQECGQCPKMVVLPAQSFMMGSPPGQGDKSGRESPRHEVTIPREFAVAESPVTFAEFDLCAQYGDCSPQISGNSHDARPAANVTWRDAQGYAAWLTRITGRPYRLLSEAEFEYAARGGTETAFPWGDTIGSGNANCGDCGNEAANTGTTRVGSFPPNRFELYDMAGNVFEWVEDCFHADYEGAPDDGSAWFEEGCPRRVVRGGSWISRSSMLRSAARDWRQANERHNDVGFRVARDLTP